MESLKKPEMILTVTNTVGLIGSITYFYKKTNGLQEKLDDIESKLLATLKKFTELPDHKAHIDELTTHINKLNGFTVHTRNVIGELKGEIDYNMELVRDDMNAIVDAIREFGVTVKLPSERERKKLKKKPANSRHPKPILKKHHPPPTEEPEEEEEEKNTTEEEEEEEEEVKPKPKPKKFSHKDEEEEEEKDDVDRALSLARKHNRR